MISIRAKYFIHRFHLAIVFLLLLLIAILSITFYDKLTDWKILVPIVGGIFSFFYFVQKQQLEESRLFKELFTDFNKRYDTLNETLNEIKNGKPIGATETNILYDYFNLCSEEYLFYQKGYIYPEVWQSWLLGMMEFYRHAGIRKIWDEELAKGSYYGLEKEVKKAARQLET